MWLLDTNVLSELRRPRPAPAVVAFVAGQPLERLFVSVVTLAELRYGIERVSDPSRRADLADWLEQRVRPMFAGRVLPLSEAVMLRWRRLVQSGREAGHTYPQPDLLIAATAIEYSATLVSRDTEDFRRTGAPLHDPWAG